MNHQYRFPRSIREANYWRNSQGLPIICNDSGTGSSIKTLLVVGIALAIVALTGMKLP
ncbi:MAG: hypothetical protein KGI54_13720 [Pseudomonadota bacterium]|nr:hypothetical protein [Pseudomonadota bacterium]